MIQHHLTEDQLVAYSSGAATPADALLVASHLTLCPVCRAQAQAAEHVGGAMLASADPIESGLDELLAATLGRLDEPAPEPEPVRYDPAGVLPAPLAALVGPFDELRWTRVFPNVRQVVVDIPTTGMPVRLFDLKPGSRVPDHRHRGSEVQLVLRGAFTDDEGRFARGDVCIRGEDRVHRQRIEPDEQCVVLAVVDHPLIPRTLGGWLASRIRDL